MNVVPYVYVEPGHLWGANEYVYINSSIENQSDYFRPRAVMFRTTTAYISHRT